MPSPAKRRPAPRSQPPRGDPARARRPPRRSHITLAAWLVAAAVALVTCVTYLGALDHAFVTWDDQDYVQENPLVRDHQYGELLGAVVSNHYHPLTMLSLARDATSPLTARPFITTNIALHVLNTLLVFWLALLLSARRLPVAAITALLFGIHPMHVESVAWISERKDVLYGFFFLAATIAYLRYLERRTLWLLLLTFTLFVLSCLSKEMAVAFPAVMFLLDYWKGRRFMEPGGLLEKVPFFAVALLFGLIVMDLQSGRDFHGLLRVVGERAVVLSTPPGLSPLNRLTVPAYGFMMYLWRLFVPLDLCAFYPFPDAGEARRLAFLVAPFVFLGALALAIWDRRRSRVIAFGLGWFLFTVALVLRWIPAGLVIMGDRYAYVSYVGLLFMLAMGFQSVVDRRPALRPVAWGAAALFAVWMLAITLPQIETWKDSEALWSRVIRTQPRVGSAYLYRAKHRFDAGRVEEAQSDFRSAFALGVQSGEVYGGLGITYGALGQLDSSLVMLDRAVALMPARAALYQSRAVTYLGLDRPREALADLDRGLALDPPSPVRFYTARGFAHMRLGEPQAAAAEFDRAITAGADDDATWYGRGSARLALGDRAGATADLREALRRNPGNAGAREQLRILGE